MLSNDNKAEEKFKEINEAYEVLGNEDKGEKHDQFGNRLVFQDRLIRRNMVLEQEMAVAGMNTEEGFSDFFEMFFSDGE